MATKNSKIVKTFVGRSVDTKGNWVRVDKQKMFIESGGELRMFLEVPQHIVDFMGPECVSRHNDKPVLFGRDPESLERQYNNLCNKFVDQLKASRTSPVIIVRLLLNLPDDHKRSNGHRFRGEPDFSLEFDMQRYLRDGKTYYQWSEDEDPELRHVFGLYDGVTADKTRVELPYTPELWGQLEAVQNRLVMGATLFYDLVFGKDFQKMLSQSSINLLGVDPK